jgi:hypothetical protein
MILDDRVPASVRELLLEADGCVASGFTTGATACAHRALEAILKKEKAEGATQDARIRALGEKSLGVPALLVSVLTQLGDGPAREAAKLTANTLQLFLTTLKAVAYEIYVVGPERAERLQHVRKLVDATERKDSDAVSERKTWNSSSDERRAWDAPSERKATPANLASMSPTGSI